ncbi:hypothetical protein OJ996_14430 [Luteolibacter sp. GHJ8]|uniref:Uncharacterized protein n=1 Tax=Luteolibacter rhizosphaerae TaxID=2989719 RepID=A0ABT3G6B3_9BACT|nr:hypothetical protein [Luteolibacter rhizosphaerae]MCW1914780.1 hypothetical protein [Luteolibacter rhizosphaerae]
MKTLSNTALPALGLLCLAAVSCNPEDPSAQREAQKLVAEAAAKNARLEDEVASLKAELATANSKISEAEAVKMPGVSEIEGKLDAALSKLRESARKSHPSATVEGVTTWDVVIPSPEKLFTCKAKALVREPNGLLKTVYWTGSADIKGEWTFTSAVDLEPKAQPPPVASTQDPSDPAPEPPPKPAPPKEKPKPQYDIPLDRPVMGPK